MPSDKLAAPAPKSMTWTGRILSVLAALFLVFDAVGHLVMPVPVVQAFTRLGFPLKLGPTLGILEILCIIIYVIPGTSIFGAILVTGYLGGAVAINWRVGDPLFETIFPVLFGIVVWAGVYLRDGRLRALIPIRN
jgi:hypothetical protein